MGTGKQLRDHFNALGTASISFDQAAGAGVELVHHHDSNHHPIFHTFDGDIVYRDSASDRWELNDGARKGVHVQSGEVMRIHQPYIAESANIADTAQVDPTATIEPGARVGPHAVVGRHAHVGKDTTVASYARVEDGAFVGAFSTVKEASRVGPGAIVGAGSRIGPTANVGAGARLEQRTSVEAFDNIAAHTRVGTSPHKASAGAGLHPGQVSYLVDRLAALDRD